jgi:hypothetical protein
MRDLAYNVAEIIRIDRELGEFVSSRKVIHISELAPYRALKEERRGHVRVIQNYKPTGQVY